MFHPRTVRDAVAKIARSRERSWEGYSGTLSDMSVGFDDFDEEKERGRLRKLSDEELIREGKAARSLCDPRGRNGKPPRDVFVIGLRLCKEEWRRRHPYPKS
jgi:hypothetical protein